MNNKKLCEFDNEVFNVIQDELKRQRTHIELIASENFVSKAVLEAQGSCLTNKYAEGYSGKRYYGGCENVDVVETLAIERACKLFNANFANVQPHSGASANLAAYNAILMPGDKILGMSLDAGGHLTHGYSVNFSGKMYTAPMWRKIHQKLNSHYKYFHGKMYVIPTSKWINWLPRRPKTVTFNYAPFDRFFHDSDPSSYYDPIIGVDAGDISLLQYENDEPLYFLTRGITDPISRRAIAKTALVYPIDLSFVDTPKEKMTHNITQLKKTIKLIHSVPNNQGIARIWHMHLKSGPSVSDGTFLGEHVVKLPICPSGRANQFHPSELDMNHPNDKYPFLINPNGDVVAPYCLSTRYVQEKLNNIFAPSRERE